MRRDGTVVLEAGLGRAVPGVRLDGSDLGRTVQADQAFEDPDGHPVSFAKDLLGACDPGAAFAGPLATLGAEVTSTVLWG